MKSIIVLFFTFFLLAASSVIAAIVVPGADGSDGSLVITANTEIDLSQAVTGVWDQSNSANAGKGVYDPQKWAVVFKYSSVTVNAGATVTFKNHPSLAPVVWLVSGDVTIAGTVNVSGQNGRAPPTWAEAGPGGFRGGTGWYTASLRASAGFGPGGGGRPTNTDGYGGSYGSVGSSGPATYGNPSLIPLIGGSGGAGDPNDTAAGGGGGGAILIASSLSISVTGSILANGGNSMNSNQPGGGSGGGIRLVSNSLTGNGQIRANNGGTTYGYSGGFGRIRIERTQVAGSISVSPDPSVLPLTAGSTALLWPPASAPKVEVVSVGGETVPADPRASFGAFGPDVAVPQSSTVSVIIRTENVEEASQVELRITPRFNANFTTVNATVKEVISTSPLVILWEAVVPTAVGYSALQVKVIRP